MLNGICILSVIPMRKKPSDQSEMINQVLFGEVFEIIEKQKKWSYIKLAHDKYEGWIDNKQYKRIQELKTNYKISNKKYAQIKINSIKQPVLLGSLIPKNVKLKKRIGIVESLTFFEMKPFEKWFLNVAKKYLNTPYMWGGRTPIGIDCSGYTQMVYRFFNIQLPRDAWQQAKQGKKVINMNNIQIGDLAFFGTKNKINHVGILLGKKKIIHASGKVKIDLIDKKGIFCFKSQEYSHILQEIKRVF